jgi:pimeloyl-ACP methyl ester carboxylesterase
LLWGISRELETCLAGPNVKLVHARDVRVELDHVRRGLKLVCRSRSASRALSAIAANRALRRSALVGFGGCFGDLQLLDGEFFETSVAPLIRDAEGPRSILAHVDLTWTDHLNDVHSRIEAPIHLFWGEQDPFFPLSGAREMAKSFKQGGELRVIPGAKLYVHEEAPTELAAFSLAMLDRAAAGANAYAAPLGIERASNLQS